MICKYKITLGNKIETRSGAELCARVYKPRELQGPVPAIFTMTPYTADSQHPSADKITQARFVYVVVDIRGRGGSTGTFTPLKGDGEDGRDVVTWIANQSWCDGRVAMMGGSYGGMVQWQTAATAPPALCTIAPRASVHPGYDFPLFQGIFFAYDAQWLALNSAHAFQGNLFADSSYWATEFADHFRNGRPFSELSKLADENSHILKEWIDHPGYDEYWRSHNPTPQQYARIYIPILTTTGYFDDDQPGALKYYREHLANVDKETASRHYLVMGPYSHVGTLDPEKLHGGVTIPENALIDVRKLHADWYNYVFNDAPLPDLINKGNVAYYMMGADEWRQANTLESITTSHMKYYLSPGNNGAKNVFASGELVPLSSAKHEIAVFKSDPADISFADRFVSEAATMEQNYLVDQSFAFQQEKLVYHSASLENTVDVAGFIRLQMYIEIDTPDVDLNVHISEVKPDGSIFRLGNAIMRARYHKSIEKEKLITPGEINLYQFRDFYWIAKRMEAGSCLRLVVSTLNRPELQKNYNAGGDLRFEGAAKGRISTVTVHHGSDYPSMMELPLNT